MLKITLTSEAGIHSLVLEGKLTGPWVAELRKFWRKMALVPKRPLLVDLSGVSHIDADGRVLLGKMHQMGAKLEASGLLTQSIIEDISR